jgi:antitoxin (DNA-binding transcriptional repressor) of toxin-antitoxin stability system
MYKPMSTRYTVSQVRERLSDALDQADQGIPVIIERRGTRYVLALAPASRPKRVAPRKPRIEILDPAVESGDWTWAPTSKGLTFRARKRR